MTLLTPLGLWGLLGIVALIIIYIIRPNYQQKFISSTYIWKLSLKYRKKKIPTSKLRNLLLILCQILILTLCAAILTQPAKVLKVQLSETEVIAIIDSSASMRTKSNGETRFGRAVEEVQALVEDTFNANGIVSVIVADASVEDYLVMRATNAERTLVEEKLAPLADPEVDACMYGESNIAEAITLCEEVLYENPSAKIYLYTDVSYGYVPEGIEVVNVADEEEWNAAILNASTKLENSFYSFYVDVAYYCTEAHDNTARSMLSLTLEVENCNPNADGFGTTVTVTADTYCTRNQPKRLVFLTKANYDAVLENVENLGDDSEIEYIILEETQEIYSYKQVYIALNMPNDSYAEDDYFMIYNGQKEVLKVQYASGGSSKDSPAANRFFRGALLVLGSNYSDKWDIRLTEVKQGEAPALEGFDLYIFEHIMPESMPTDGVVLLSDPNKAPDGAGFKMEEYNKNLRQSVYLTVDQEEHPLLKNIKGDELTVSRISVVTAEGNYKSLLSCDMNPMIMVKNEPTEKVVLMNFSINYTNWSIAHGDFVMFVRNVFDYFFPTTASDYDFEVYESVQLNSRGEKLSVSFGNQELESFETFPSQLTMSRPGTYSLTQKNPFTNKDIKEYIFVKIPAAESNIWKEDETLSDPYRVEEEIDFFKDWLPYLAGALVAFLFIEWWLQSRETM